MTRQTHTGRSTPDSNDLLEAFLKGAKLQDLTEYTLAAYKSSVHFFLSWIGVDPLAVDQQTLRNFLDDLRNHRRAKDGSVGLAPTTVNHYFAAIEKFCEFLRFEGHVDDNPVPDFRSRYLDMRRPSPQSQRQLNSVEEMAALGKSTLDNRNRTVIITLAKTGIRRRADPDRPRRHRLAGGVSGPYSTYHSASYSSIGSRFPSLNTAS